MTFQTGQTKWDGGSDLLTVGFSTYPSWLEGETPYSGQWFSFKKLSSPFEKEPFYDLDIPTAISFNTLNDKTIRTLLNSKNKILTKITYLNFKWSGFPTNWNNASQNDQTHLFPSPTLEKSEKNVYFWGDQIVISCWNILRSISVHKTQAIFTCLSCFEFIITALLLK